MLTKQLKDQESLWSGRNRGTRSFPSYKDLADNGSGKHE